MELDFSGLRYNYTQARSTILESFPDLKKIKGMEKLQEEHRGISREILLRYIILMYDPGSPINEADLMMRKSMCGIEAGLPRTKKGRFMAEAEKIIMLEDEVITEIIIEFVTSFHSATYSKFVAYQQHYDSILRDLVKGKERKIKLEDIDTLERSINEMQARMLRDNAPMLVEALYEKVVSDQLLLRPEDIAEKIENGEDPVDIRPYGDYTKKKYPWKGTRLVEN